MKKYLTDFSYARKASEYTINKKEAHMMQFEGSLPEVEVVKEINLIVENNHTDSFAMLDVIVKCVKTGNMYATCSGFVKEMTNADLRDLEAVRQMFVFW